MMHYGPMHSIVYTELAYTAIIIILCMYIYYKTKEIYILTKHQGIGFFRNTFLFFALAYLFRFLFHLFRVSGLAFELKIPMHTLGPVSLVLTSFLSTMAILSLAFSTMYKDVNVRLINLLIPVVAFFIAILIFLTHSPNILIVSQLALLVAAIIVAYKTHRKSKRFSKLFSIYLLLFIFWIANLSVLGPRMFMPFEFRLVLDLISISIFGLITHKVMRWTR